MNKRFKDPDNKEWLQIFICVFALMLIIPAQRIQAEDGYRLWLRYDPVNDPELLELYREQVSYLVVSWEEQQVPEVAINELTAGIKGLIDVDLEVKERVDGPGAIVLATPESKAFRRSKDFSSVLDLIGNEGYAIYTELYEGEECVIILGNDPVGVLYGVFHFLRLMQKHEGIAHLDVVESPKISRRILNHWDNLDRTVERGYAGFSIWDWHRLPEYQPARYVDYARANASIGINGTVLTNVNSNALVLTSSYLKKVAALADIFRPYGIRVYLTARFNAPVELKELETADPLDEQVQEWWNEKANEIYQMIPDFGGFLVKANSEGQPGPQNYGRNHAEGANMLADAVAEHGGIVMWRAFVYDQNVPDDRAKQAYNEFVPLDGQFRKNVLIQVKNGAIDFQPREPFHPMFGAMPATPLAMEFQITQEYLGQGTSLCYLAPMYKECLDADTYAKGDGSEVAKIIDGSLLGHSLSAIAGVSNIGNDRNWTGHHFGQANWYAYGRLAWDHSLTAESIADEWLRMTFTHDPDFIRDISIIMQMSREIVTNYMTPLGLHHIMGRGHHYGPGPWVAGGRPDWTSVYYHRADSAGIGFDRSARGSNAVGQYFEEVALKFGNPETCPDQYLLWFHHLDWDYITGSGRTVWDELCHRYYSGAESVTWMREMWLKQEEKMDSERFEEVISLLRIQEEEAIWWRDACILYFQTFSKLPIPEHHSPPEVTLEELKNRKFPYAPGIKPRW